MKDIFPFKIKTKFTWGTSAEEFAEMREWLLNNIGEPKVDWMLGYDSPPNQDSMYIQFIKEEDAILFALKWL